MNKITLCILLILTLAAGVTFAQPGVADQLVDLYGELGFLGQAVELVGKLVWSG